MSVAAAPNDEGEANEALPQTFTTGENTVTLTASEDGKTLTISGKGDLTKLDATYKFTASASNKIFKKSGSNYSSVATHETCESSDSYYTRTEKYDAIENFADSHVTEKTHYYFSTNGAKKYYTESSDWSTGSEVKKMTLVTEGTEVSSQTASVQDENGNWVNKSIYFTKNTDDTYTRVASVSTITSNTDDVTSKSIKHLKDCNNVFVKNGDSYSQVYNDAEYTESQTYYQMSYEYTAQTLEYLTSNSYVYNANGLIQALWAVGKAATVETVKFVNEGSDALLIDNDIIKAILYWQKTEYGNTWYESDTALKTFDLGAATCKNFSQTTFTNDLDARGSLAITDLTLPLAEANNGVMTVPSLVVEQLRGANGTQPLAKLTVPTGYTKIGARAFLYLNNVNFTLPNEITEIGESAFQQTGMTEWVLPTSLVTIGNNAFRDCNTLSSVTFPESLRTIGHSAFANDLALRQIDLNEGLEVISNCAFYRSSSTDDQKVLQVPSSVKYMGPGAFFGHRFMDVYYYGEKAPLSPYGKIDEDTYANYSAFGAEVYMGNNGFTPADYDGSSTCGNITTGYANRENYINNNNYIAVLHFRSKISDDNAETFTDITRKYEHWLTPKLDNQGNPTGETYWYPSDKKQVGNETETLSFSTQSITDPGKVNPGYEDTELGSQLTWPSQTQWMRSYICNSNGVKWDGTTKYRPTLTDEEKDLIRKQEGWNDNSTVTDDDLSKLAYMGSRQFVLVSRDVKGPNPDYPVPVTSGERWWTLVVPCNVTKAEVDKVFGAGTHLCLFSKVVRTIDETKGNTLHLYFQNDTYVNKYVRNINGTWRQDGAVSSDDDVVLYAHTPYMIYPTKRNDDGKEYILSNYQLQEGDVRITVVDSNDGDEQTSIKYEFAGTYRSSITTTTTDEEGNKTTTTSPVRIPQYTYAFGKKGNSNSQFWFYTGTQGTWVANKCLVERYDEKGEEDFNTFFKGDANNSKVNQISTFGGDEETTAIDRVVYHYGDDSTDAPVYNLNGQMVSADGSTDSLTKGIYIQNGKKFVVK